MAGDDESLVVFAADLHTNSMTGLCPPKLRRSGGGTYHPNRDQREIWRHWIAAWEYVAERKKELGGIATYGAFVGDLGDLNRHDGVDLISHNRHDVLRFCIDALSPAIDALDKFFVLEGTEAHVGRGHWLEHALADDLGAEQNPHTGNAAWDWLKLRAGGLMFDIMHHPRTSSRRPWTRDAAPQRQASIVRYEYMDRGDTPPDIVIRAHCHGRARGFSDATYCEFLRPWQITTRFGSRLGIDADFEPVGVLIFHVRDGAMVGMPDDHSYPLRHRRRKEWHG